MELKGLTLARTSHCLNLHFCLILLGPPNFFMSLQKSHWAQSSVLLQGSHSPHILTERFTWGKLTRGNKSQDILENKKWNPKQKNVQTLLNYIRLWGRSANPSHACSESTSAYNDHNNTTYFGSTPPFTSIVWSTWSAVLSFTSVRVGFLVTIFLWSVFYFQQGVFFWWSQIQGRGILFISRQIKNQSEFYFI